MKLMMYILMLTFAFTCGNTEPESKEAELAKEVSAATTSPTEDQDMLLGEVEKQDLMQAPYASWFEAGYNSYTPEPEALEVLKKNLDEYHIKGYFGTWCGDSRREVPKFYRLLELANYDMSQLEMYAVDYNKSLPDGSEKEVDIQYVPTFIFYKDGQEVGRFVEYPQESLAKDIAKIVSGQPYKHSYE